MSLFNLGAIAIPWIVAAISTIIVKKLSGSIWWVYLIYVVLVCIAHTLLVIRFAAGV